MSENEQHELQRLDFQSRLPAGFDTLTPEEQKEVMHRLLDQDIKLREEFLVKWNKSDVAKYDLDKAIDFVRNLDHERKIYTHKQKAETGSGTIETTIRGGDTRFIIPVLVVIGIVLLGIILILALR